MNESDAFRAAIKAYWKGDEYETADSFKDKKYNKKYFDSVKTEMLGDKEIKADKKKEKEKY
jgi:hypothetical protein